jgi:hypothetical protein
MPRNGRPFTLLPTLAVALLVIAACHSMRPLEREKWNPADLPQRIWVTGPDHTTIRLDAPRITDDTLAGWVAGEYREMPLSDATAIRTRERAPARTAVVVTVTTVAMLGAFIYLEGQRDVGNAQVCLNASANIPMPFTPCCPTQDSVPC